MINGVSYFEDREEEIDGFIYIFSGRVDFKYARNETSIFLDMELISVEIETVNKYDEDGEVGITEEECLMIKDLVEDRYDEFIDDDDLS